MPLHVESRRARIAKYFGKSSWLLDSAAAKSEARVFYKASQVFHVCLLHHERPPLDDEQTGSVCRPVFVHALPPVLEGTVGFLAPELFVVPVWGAEFQPLHLFA